jgi:succinate-semialdehyde dehydrogenase/glutarate-semialdehyde dehydrogenase/succinate-semialdehyde dehydrogenase
MDLPDRISPEGLAAALSRELDRTRPRVDFKAPIAQEEFFGPVALMFPFDSEDEAVRLANDNVYGLGGTVFTQDHDKAERVVSQVEAGVIFINDFVRSDPRAPFGGVKNSGFGRPHVPAA